MHFSSAHCCQWISKFSLINWLSLVRIMFLFSTCSSCHLHNVIFSCKVLTNCLSSENGISSNLCHTLSIITFQYGFFSCGIFYYFQLCALSQFYLCQNCKTVSGFVKVIEKILLTFCGTSFNNSSGSVGINCKMNRYIVRICFLCVQVWYRVIQIVINRDDVQGYAAKTVFEVSWFA